MSRVLTRFCACATAFCVPFALVAQSEGAEDAASAEMPVAVPSKPSAKHFHTLVKLAYANGNVSVKLPRQASFQSAVEGKFYPNGSVFRITKSEAEPVVFEFGPNSLVKVSENAEFGVRETPISDKTRTVTMISGQILVSLPRTMPTGMFTVAYPNFTVKDLAGESNHELIPSGDGDEGVVHLVTGMLSVEGRHYKIARMGAADRVRIRTTADALFTSLRGESGDYKVTLEKGVSAYRDLISGKVTEQSKTLDYSLTPQCAIKIFRKRSQIGGRVAVSVMTFNPAGEICNRYTFAEGTSKVNFGEEIVKVNEISFKTKSDDKKSEAKAEKSAEEAPASQEGAAESAESTESPANNDTGFGVL